MLQKNVPYGKIIQTPFPTKPLEVLPGFPVSIPGIVFLTAAPIFPAAFDSYFFKIVHEDPAVISHERFYRAGFCEIKVGSICCSLLWWWQWHLFDSVLVDLWVCRGID